jgi:hypothetical protein
MKRALVVDPLAHGVWRLEQRLSGDWGRSMTVVRLRDGGLLVHSPTWLGEGTFETVDELGPVRVLFAPNHFHHLSLTRFAVRYPSALTIATSVAIPRLTSKGHDGLVAVSEAASMLPHGAHFLECAGTRAGEGWISLESDRRTWIVCDAFFHVTRHVTGAAGIFLRVTRAWPGLSLGETFRWFALRDAPSYRAWALEMLERERPKRMLFSHGEAVEREDLPEELARLIRLRL